MGHGDSLMVSGRARVMQQADPRKCKVTYQGVHKTGRWDSILEHNPRIAKPGEPGDFQELQARDMANNRPYHLGKTPERWTYNPAFRPDVGEIYFTYAERAFGKLHAGKIIVEPHIKFGASPNKSWGWARWNKLGWFMSKAGLQVTQLGPVGTPLLERAELVVTPTFRDACAVLENAMAAVLPEGGMHHAAAAMGLPAVVIFGGFIPVEITGYDMHSNLGASLDSACGSRTFCNHCQDWMERITPEEVFDEAIRRLASSGSRRTLDRLDASS